MSTHVILVDLLGLLFAVAGFHMAFRQRVVRDLWESGRAARGLPAKTRPTRPEGEDPVHYALIIFGMMLFAFGLIVIGFTTAYALMT
ncbi:MAG: hypothetical protein JO013_00265 [Alphaproteobacteria bacterium]|nr:hypothetical protein [Alphaproteobacteria bacterium]